MKETDLRWYKTILTEYDVRKNIDKGIIKDFIKLMVENNTPEGLAMFSGNLEQIIIEKQIYYFSIPDKYHLLLENWIEKNHLIEVPAPNLAELKPILGK